jgi:excisionase family DNA binding protein
MFTVRDIQERYRVSNHTVLAWIRTGELKAIKVNRKLGARKPRWRISQAAVDAFEALRSSSPPVPVPSRRKYLPRDVIEFIK